MRRFWIPSILLTSSSLFAWVLLSSKANLAIEGPTARAVPQSDEWELAWSDEFDAPDGSRPDPGKWHLETGGGGWGNHELEYYTSRRENAHVAGGNLIIEARRETYQGADGVVRRYTSARLSSEERFAQAYGKFTARIRIPGGQGLWPAFWLLGNDFQSKKWPGCGEIDVMENIGREPSTIHGSMHGPGYSGKLDFSSSLKLPAGRKYSDEFHEFTVQWQPGVVRFFADGEGYAVFRPSLLPPGKSWVFDHPFFIILNLAVGGDWPGAPTPATRFPAQMFVDYVRVYRKAAARP
jgi:beta-glucanase (GH16 family)